MKRTVLALASLILGWGVAFAQDEDASEAKDPRAALVQSKSAFKETWVHPEADFSKYDKIYLWEATFEYRDVGPARRTQSAFMRTHKREFGILESDRRKFEEAVSESFVKELEKGKRFTIVDTVGPGTLILRGAALDIISMVPPKTIGRSEIYVANIGEATLVLELIDAETGEVLALVAERRRIQQGTGRIDEFSMPTNSATVLAAVRRWARQAGSKLRSELDKALQ